MATYISIETDKKISYQIDGGDKQTMFANIEDDGYPEPTGTITITENGTGIDVKDYAEADVNVPGGGYPEPTGTITITENGTGIDVKDYAEADVDVPTYPEPTGTKQISIAQNGTTTENVKDYASAEIMVNVAGSGGTLEQIMDEVIAGTITSYVNPTITTLPDSMFRGTVWGVITTFQAHAVTNLSNYSVNGIGALALAFPNIINIGYTFNGNSHTKKIDFGPNLAKLTSGSTQNAISLDTLIFRSSTVVPCESTNVVANTNFKSGGTGGTIYIPKALYDHLGDGTSLDYKAATNWNTIDGYGTITWAAIEGSQYETYYADGTLIPTGGGE